MENMLIAEMVDLVEGKVKGKTRKARMDYAKITVSLVEVMERMQESMDVILDELRLLKQQGDLNFKLSEEESMFFKVCS